MSEEELDAWYENVNRPYDENELEAHLKWRRVKSALEFTHAHNLELIEIVREWIAFVDGKGPKPDNKLWRLLMPGTTMDNPACLRLETIVDFFSQYGHGKAPRMPIVVIVSQSTNTLVELLDELYHTEQIDAALLHIRNFFSLIAYGGRATMKQAAFGEKLRGEMAQFIANCTANAHKLGIFLVDKIRSDPNRVLKPATAADVKTAADSAANKVVAAVEKGADKVAKVVRRKPGKKPRFPLEVQEAAQSIWERDKNNPVIKTRKNHRIGHEDSFGHSKSDYIALGISDVKTLDKVLGAKSDRIGRSNKKRIGRQ